VDTDLAKDAERWIVAYIADRLSQYPRTQSVGEVLHVSETDPQEPKEPLGLGPPDPVIGVQAVSNEFLLDSHRPVGARHGLAERRWPRLGRIAGTHHLRALARGDELALSPLDALPPASRL